MPNGGRRCPSVALGTVSAFSAGSLGKPKYAAANFGTVRELEQSPVRHGEHRREGEAEESKGIHSTTTTSPVCSAKVAAWGSFWLSSRT